MDFMQIEYAIYLEARYQDYLYDFGDQTWFAYSREDWYNKIDQA